MRKIHLLKKSLNLKSTSDLKRIAHYVILKDEEQMDQIQEVVEKWGKSSYTKFIREHLRKPGSSWFSARNLDASSINWATWSCTNSDTRPAPSNAIGVHTFAGGLKFWKCELCLRPNEDTIKKIQARFQTLIAPHAISAVNPNSKRITGRPWKLQRGINKNCHKTITIRWQEYEKYREPQLTDGVRRTANIWITSIRLISSTLPRGDKDTCESVCCGCNHFFYS